MKYLQLVWVLALTALSYAQVPVAEKLDPVTAVKNSIVDTITWFDVREAPFDLAGFEWIDRDSVFRRLPLDPDYKLPKAVDNGANQTAGGQLRFKTNSNTIYLKVELLKRSAMYHMPATGQSGFDLYIKKKEKQRYVQTARFPHDTLQYQQEFKVGTIKEMQSFTMNFPLYNGVKSVLIGVEKGSLVEKPVPFAQPGKIVIYGTSITQGGLCVKARNGIFEYP